ncbi:hypothetical protein CCACVL1_23043, partial [Corchorus capsularis]
MEHDGFFFVLIRYQGFALTNPDRTRVVHLVMVGESSNRGSC